jgi:hypothetical protein
MAKQTETRTTVSPDRRPLTSTQASRLASLTGLSSKELTGLNISEINEKFRWRIDPELLLFRRICGTVVKHDPATGQDFPVPFATVHVEDTDCSFLGFFPVENPWAWFFPFFCRREEIGTTTTDACGKFCVWVPRFEIDWILRFRRERVCFPTLLVKPTIGELLQSLEKVPTIPPHGPGPDPAPFVSKLSVAAQRTAEQILGTQRFSRLVAAQASATIGSSTVQAQALLERPAFPQSLKPPVSPEFHPPLLKAVSPGEHASHVTNTLAARLNLNQAALKDFNLNRFIGPFIRCFDIFVPEWVPILDVPDITFRVTQNINGTEQTIYSEGFFDVRWNAGNIADVTLHATPNAVAGHACDVPDVPCADKPAIQFVGLMPLLNPAAPADPYVGNPGDPTYFGYARRPNRPHPSGLISDSNPHPLSQAPYTGTLQLYGCNRVKNAAFYRLRYTYNGGTLSPFVGLTWPLYREVSGVLQELWPASDGDGWYPVLPASDDWFPDLLLLEWPTGHFADGLYVAQLEIGDASKGVIATSATVAFQIDNSAPLGLFTSLGWRYAGSGTGFTPLSFDCPLIKRDPRDIEIQLSYTVSASHLRAVQLNASGCGPESSVVLTSAVDTAQHWYTNPADNSVSNTAVFTVSAASPPGAYTFGMVATSRAFNPAGSDNGHLADWNYDPVYNDIAPSFAIAIVNN